MALVAGDVIEAARDRHKAFVRELAPQGMALRFLSQYQRELLGKIAEIDEDVLRTDTNTVMPLAVFDNGIALPANRTIVAISALTTGAVPNSLEVALVPASLRNDRSTPARAAYQIGDKLFLRGAASDWTTIGSIAVATVPVPVPVTKSTDVLVVPDTAERALIENLALAMALRGHNEPNIPAIDTGAFGARAKDAEQAYLTEVLNRTTGRAYHTRDVMHYFD